MLVQHGLALREAPPTQDPDPRNLDPWNRKKWRGTLLLQNDRVYVVVTAAPARIRENRNQELVAYWVRKLGKVTDSKKLRIPSDLDDIDKAAEWDATKLLQARRTFILHPDETTMARRLHVPSTTFIDTSTLPRHLQRVQTYLGKREDSDRIETMIRPTGKVLPANRGKRAEQTRQHGKEP